MRRGDDAEFRNARDGANQRGLTESRFSKQAELLGDAERKLLHLRSDISHSLPHDLRTPLAAILGFAELIADGTGCYSQNELVEFGTTIRSAGQRLQRLMEDHLLFMQLELAATDPAHIDSLRSIEYTNAAELIKLLSYGIGERRGRLADVKVDLTEIPVAIGVDHLKRICTELIENAFTASEQGTEVRVVMSSKKGEFVLTVTDRSADRPLAAADPATRDPGGILRQAFGLAIARRLAELHGGRIAWSGSPEGGVTATLSIPILPRGSIVDR
jgi:two-component system, sensor histidine kinase and response regulator